MSIANMQTPERILPGVCVLSTTIGLANTSRIRELIRSASLVALLGFENVRLPAVYPGDTIKVESEIHARPSSAPKLRRSSKDVTRRQTGEVVLEAA